MNLDPEFLPLITLLLPKVLIATICGLIIGYDREIKQKVAGIRTNILICVGCAILTTTSFYLAKDNPNIDPTRIIGQIITGIGFLGAGLIFNASKGVQGVTTAATVFATAAMGVAVGLGFQLVGLAFTVIIVSILRSTQVLEHAAKTK